jgi:hypothetical protein
MEAARVVLLLRWRLRLRVRLTLDEIAVSSLQGFVGESQREEQQGDEHVATQRRRDGSRGIRGAGGAWTVAKDKVS